LRGPVEQVRSNPVTSSSGVVEKRPAIANVPQGTLQTAALPVTAVVPAIQHVIPDKAESLNPESTPVSPGPTLIQTADLLSKWQEFVNLAGEANHGYPILLANGELVGIEGDLVKLGFSYGFHRNKLNQPKNKQALENVLRKMFGLSLRVEGVHLDKKGEVGHDDAVDKPEVEAVAPTVADHILTAFGGKVVQ
jgi:hypothetical protein